MGTKLMWTTLEASLLANISFNEGCYAPNVCTGAHPGTIQSPSGNNNNHPLGNTYKGPNTNFPLHFQGAVPKISPPNFGPPKRNPLKLFPRWYTNGTNRWTTVVTDTPLGQASFISIVLHWGGPGGWVFSKGGGGGSGLPPLS